MAAPPQLDMGRHTQMGSYGNDEQAHDNAPVPTFSSTEEDKGVPLDPSAKALFEKCPSLRKIPVFSKASVAYGPATTISLGVTYFIIKGIADQLVKATMYAMLVTRFGADATRYQRLYPMASLGWSIKAFTAMFSDGFAILGYTKRWYIAGSAVLGGIFAIAYAVLPAKPSSADLGGAFIFLTSFCKANFDILAEGHYSRLMRRIPSAGSSLVTWIWILILLGYLVASVLTGPLSDMGLQHVCIYVAGGLQLVTVIFPVFNWYGEKVNRVERAVDARNNYMDAVRERQLLLERERANATNGSSTDGSDVGGIVPGSALMMGENKDLHPEHIDSSHATHPDVLDDGLDHHYDGSNNNGVLIPLDDEAMAEQAACDVAPPIPLCFGFMEMNKEILTRDWKLFVYCAIMTFSVLAMTVGNILATKIVVTIICASVAVICCSLSFWALPMAIAKANVFGYLHMVFYLRIGVLDNFFMATPDCLPDAPHFTFTFYTTVGSVIGNVAGIVGTLGFNYIFSKRSYRVTFMVTTSVQILASIFDIIIVKRWNIAIGIPDHAMYICGDAIVYQVCYMLAWMPLIVLLSRLCPRGSESVVYAILAGFGNLGTSTGSVIASMLMEYVWPIKSKAPCNFDNLVWLLVVGHLCLPLLIFPLTLLIPSARCCDDLDVDGKAIRRELQAVHKEKKVKAEGQDGDERGGKGSGVVRGEPLDETTA